MYVKKLCAVVIATVLFHAGVGAAKAPDTFPLEKVRPGQTGYGLTTMQGTQPTRFEFEVIGVAKNFLPKMDIILVKSDDPQLQVTGFWQGMSGSPLFIEGKLTCAFSYGFRFNKKAIGGCTPIHYMKHEGFKSPRRLKSETTLRHGGHSKTSSALKRPTPLSVATMAEWMELAPSGDAQAAMASLGPTRKPWLMRAPMPRMARPAAAAAAAGDEGLVAASVPLALSGFSTPAFHAAKQLMSEYPIVPMQAGGTGDPTAGPNSFQLGGAIAVQLIRGDMSAAATGTVSFVDGDGVLAFGHPMFELGELYAPVAAAQIHTVIPSAASAFVMASPLRELGALMQDRKSTIAANTSYQTRMIPVHIAVEVGSGSSKEAGTFDVEVFNNRFFTGSMISVAAMNAISHYVPDRDHVTAMMVSRVKLKGQPVIQFTDYLASDGGAGGVVGGARGLRVLVPLLMNPYTPVEIESVELDVKVSYDTNYGTIEKISLPTASLLPGKRQKVAVTMTTFDGKEFVEYVPFDVPKSLAGSIVKLEVTAGDQAPADAAPANSLSDMIRNFRKLLPGNVFAVTLSSAEEGVAIDGKLVRDLPASALDRLKTRSTTDIGTVYRPIARSTYKATRVINGRQNILVQVANLDD